MNDKGVHGVDTLLPRSFFGGGDLTNGKSLQKVLTKSAYVLRVCSLLNAPLARDSMWQSARDSVCEKKHCPYEKLLVIQRVSSVVMQRVSAPVHCRTRWIARPLLRSALQQVRQTSSEVCPATGSTDLF